MKAALWNLAKDLQLSEGKGTTIKATHTKCEKTHRDASSA
jgi:hypothetical protein